MDFRLIASAVNKQDYPKRFAFAEYQVSKEQEKLTQHNLPLYHRHRNEGLVLKEELSANFKKQEAMIEAKQKLLITLDNFIDSRIDLEEKEKKLQTDFIKFNEYVKINFYKRQRALQNIDEYDELRNRRLNEIDEIREEIALFADIYTRMREEIEKHTIYQSYMSEVLEKCEPRGNIMGLLNRYSSLDSKKRYLSKHTIDLAADFKTIQHKLLSIFSYHHSKMLQMMMELTQTTMKYEGVRQRTLRAENAISVIHQKAIDIMVDNFRAIDSIMNVYRVVCNRRKFKLKKNVDILKQALFIRRTANSLQKLLARYQEEREA